MVMFVYCCIEEQQDKISQPFFIKVISSRKRLTGIIEGGHFFRSEPPAHRDEVVSGLFSIFCAGYRNGTLTNRPVKSNLCRRFPVGCAGFLQKGD